MTTNGYRYLLARRAVLILEAADELRKLKNVCHYAEARRQNLTWAAADTPHPARPCLQLHWDGAGFKRKAAKSLRLRDQSLGNGDAD
ncbi:hypothetical protein [Mesorhizobium sp. SARCC-RB16n]|uniref:hypothetical protein n=1 Tax=Mesorhizobium sp. SARCC-RB16n TaxID=2116687 RepID=UPI0027B9105F|nr:hypothetical protein [Mesorhizobium sp. SARCC-RB16n]